jgi:hypothetical protein
MIKIRKKFLIEIQKIANIKAWIWSIYGYIIIKNKALYIL